PGGGRGRSESTPEPPMSIVKKDQVAHCEPTLTVPSSARMTEPYLHRNGEAGRYTFDADAPLGPPMRPTPFYGQVALGMSGGAEVRGALPVTHRYERNLFSGEKRNEFLVVPALSVRLTPQIAIVPAAAIRATPAPIAPTRTTGRGGRGAPPPRPTPVKADAP